MPQDAVTCEELSFDITATKKSPGTTAGGIVLCCFTPVYFGFFIKVIIRS